MVNLTVEKEIKSDRIKRKCYNDSMQQGHNRSLE